MSEQDKFEKIMYQFAINLADFLLVTTLPDVKPMNEIKCILYYPA